MTPEELEAWEERREFEPFHDYKKSKKATEKAEDFKQYDENGELVNDY